MIEKPKKGQEFSNYSILGLSLIHICRCCGAKLPPEGAEQPTDRAEEEQNFDYASFYRQFEEGNVPDPLREAYQAAFGKEEQMDGISCKDWNAYIGRSAPDVYKRQADAMRRCR